jgi:hypothetical protein
MDYEMFTEEGNAAVADVVDHARANGLNWAATLRLLIGLSRVDGGIYAECLDTAVRESVFEALGFDSVEDEFYL